MEQNLPYVSVGLIDDQYNNRVLPFLGKIDSGHLFKWFIVLFWKLASYVFLLGGLFITIKSMTGDDGYIKTTLDLEGITGAQKAGGIVGLIIGIILSIVCAWFLYSITKKRAEQLNDEDYHGVLSPSSPGVAPKGLKSTGTAEFNKVWSYMGTPCISLPLLEGENNLPLGVQLTGDLYDDHRFLGVANWLEKECNN